MHRKLANEIRTRFQHRSIQRPYIIGMDGLGGAGKTTLVHQLEAELKHTNNVVVVHMDDHIVKRNKRYHTGHEEWYEYYFLQWDMDMLTEELFKKIHRNASKLTLPFYDKSTDHHIRTTIPLTPDTIFLIEGVFLQRKEWKPYYDWTVFIHCPKEIRYERVLRRDVYLGNKEERLDTYKRRYWLGEAYYLKTEHPEKIADMVYDDMQKDIIWKEG